MRTLWFQTLKGSLQTGNPTRAPARKRYGFKPSKDLYKPPTGLRIS
ncbi:MAG: hypothetical protein MjAS7_1973 [Metallosphaera javensis (ex Sakai et al. 2022)]|nr:MAG: hypothetical protein MjAS7_1973 [Metallosphaera javensis (ex Sakai et al. 2022)]